MENIFRLKYLFKKYIETECTPDEKNEFFKMVADDRYALALKDIIKEQIDFKNVLEENISKTRTEQLFRRIEKVTGENEKVVPIQLNKKLNKRRSVKWWAAAAAFFLILLSSTYFIYNHPASKPLAEKKTIPVKSNDLEPGHSGAVLTLSNGKKIILDSAENGLLASQGKSNVVKVNGQLVYKTQNNSANEVLYNTMTTAKGRQYQLVLGDGSKVWLNAASSITYPTTFNRRERKVEITGEAYFEVSKVYKNPDMKERVPFIVIINSVSGNKRQVEVLGTHFNVMAYDDEPAVKTTLLEGSVKVLNDGKSVTIRPGEQAVLSNEKVNVMNTDVNEAVAWKNKMFSFNNATIEMIMRQVERWYDVDVVYNGAIPKGHYRGEVPMNVNASEMLKVLEAGGIHFKIDGKRIIVEK